MLNKSDMVMTTSCMRPPPAVPWSARPTTSIFISAARAQMMELLKNMETAVSSIGFRPQISESLAHIGPAAAFARRYAPPIQPYPEADLNSFVIVGTAVATIV